MLFRSNEWTHLVLTWDNLLGDDQIKVFQNGTLFQTFDRTVSSVTPAQFWLGSRYSNNEAWRGGIDEFSVYDYPLSYAEVMELFEEGLTGVPEPCTAVLLALGASASGLGLRRRMRR